VRITADDEKALIKTHDVLIREPFFQIEMRIEDEMSPIVSPMSSPYASPRDASSKDDQEGKGAAGGKDDAIPAAAAAPEMQPIGIIKLFPTPRHFESAVQQIIRDGIELINIPEPLLTHRDLQTYVTAAASGGQGGEDAMAGPNENDHGGDIAGGSNSGETSSSMPTMSDRDIVSLVHEADQYPALYEGVFSGIRGWFDEVVEYTEVFAPYQKLYTENECTRMTIHETFASVPMDVFRTAIAKYRAQGDQFSGIPYLADIGLIRVNSSKLKAMLLPNPEAMITNIRELLPLLMQEDAESLIEDMTDMSREMSSTPHDAMEFVHKMEQLEMAEAQLPKLLKKFDRFMQMARLCTQENNWTLPDSVKNQQVLLTQMEKLVTEGIERTGANRDEDTARFRQEIKDEIPTKVTAVMRTVIAGLDDTRIQDDKSSASVVLDYLSGLEESLHQARKNADNFTAFQEALEEPDVTEYEELDDVEADFAVKKALWEGIRDWEQLTNAWEGTLMGDIVASDMDKQVNNYVRLAGKSKMKLQACPSAVKLSEDVSQFRNLLPVIVDLRNPALKRRHWEQIESTLGYTFDNEVKPPEAHLLRELLDLNVQEHKEALQQISTAATAEGALVDLYSTKVTSVWKDLEFIVNPYKEYRDAWILGSVEDIQVALDESLVQLNTILGSRYCRPIRDQVMHSQAQLLLLSDTLEEWLQCQKKWMYLETIFGAPDIQRQLPKESALFDKVDKSWKGIMAATNNYPSALVAGTAKGRKDLLASHNESLDHIQKNLEAYLETKRQAFPRFYFLSDDELLEILAQTRDPRAVQPHLRKCFDCIQQLEFGDDKSIDIHAMISPEKERVSLGKAMKARGAVEEWLMAVQDRMQKVVKDLLHVAVDDYEKHDERTEWVCNAGHPGQCVATGALIMWTKYTEDVLRDSGGDNPTPNGMKIWLDKNVKMVLDLVIMIRGKLTRLQRKILAALITVDVFCKDQIDYFVENDVKKINDFAWEQQLRYYWDETWDNGNGGCVIRHANAKLGYMYEYMGCTSRLVITPLTVKCWLTITGAIHLKLGAAPAGPAGTGKTESSKDLAKAMGTFCVVFNCSDQVDYILLGRLFSGLAQCGSWCCLDEFNRILIEVLSVVAQQLLILRNGMKAGKERIDFEGRDIALLSHCVIVTMNPGYAGRTALPDNLKVCFRPIAMMVPFYAQISEIVLYSQGFSTARSLSIKMAQLYQLASQQLSQQPHYDYGLRAIISVLLMAGGNKRTNPDLGEDVILIRAMRDSNLPKFLAEDVPLFRAILIDLFPGVEVPTDDYGDLLIAIRKELEVRGLQPKEELIHKIIQLHDMIKIRFGVTLVGPTGGGKTAAYQIMVAAHTRLREENHSDEWYQVSRMDVINPKSISMGELYGENNELTQEWTDGVSIAIMCCRGCRGCRTFMFSSATNLTILSLLSSLSLAHARAHTHTYTHLTISSAPRCFANKLSSTRTIAFT
jgi:dynein heavy chain